MILEILLSTMNRSNLSFLKKMFPKGDYKDHQILIINQTTENNQLHSKLNNIRVINSFEKGVSKSRNLAIKNAKGNICLIADDDVEYEKGFDKIIESAYKEYEDANCIIFKADIFKKQTNPKYLNCSKKFSILKN